MALVQEHRPRMVDRRAGPLDSLLLETVVADAEALLKTAASSTAEGLGAAYSQFEGKLQTVKSSLDHARTVATEHGKEAMDVTNRYIGANPWKSVGMAAGVGIILGFLLSRR